MWNPQLANLLGIIVKALYPYLVVNCCNLVFEMVHWFLNPVIAIVVAQVRCSGE
jgi:hypothetical protein